MSSRESILADIRKALGNRAPVPPPVYDVALTQPVRGVELFRDRLEVLGGKVYLRKRAEVLDVVKGIVGDGSCVASNAPLLVELGITNLPKVRGGFQTEPALREACAIADFGITSADYALAETGSLVTLASSEARLISLLPPEHIAILSVSRMLTGLDELFAKHPKPADLASSMVMITGPSRSADIEMILVRGVHGPRAIHVILIEEDV